MKQKCKNCDKEFESEYEEKFCSDKCFRQYQKRRLRGKGLIMR